MRLLDGNSTEGFAYILHHGWTDYEKVTAYYGFGQALFGSRGILIRGWYVLGMAGAGRLGAMQVFGACEMSEMAK